MRQATQQSTSIPAFELTRDGRVNAILPIGDGASIVCTITPGELVELITVGTRCVNRHLADFLTAVPLFGEPPPVRPQH